MKTLPLVNVSFSMSGQQWCPQPNGVKILHKFELSQAGLTRHIPHDLAHDIYGKD